MNQFQHAEAVIREALDRQIVPSAAYAIGCGENVLAADVIGSRAVYPERLPADENTLYDMASLTKILATTPVILHLIETGQIILTDPVGRFFTAEELKDAPAGREKVTVFELLTHTSGITPHLPLWTMIDGSLSPEGRQNAAVRAILASKPLPRPLDMVYYSCMGFILLQVIAERVTGRPLDELARAWVFDPLGMVHTGFRRANRQGNPRAVNIASTECKGDGQDYICGHVHDENACFLGGVSGNAGVFSTLGDMARFAGMLAGRGTYGGVPVISRRMFEVAAADYTPTLDESRGLGFQLCPPRPKLFPGGDLMTVGSLGHTGFTGTSLYVDRETGVWGLLLTNAVHFGRDKVEFFRVRRRFYNAVMAAF